MESFDRKSTELDYRLPHGKMLLYGLRVEKGGPHRKKPRQADRALVYEVPMPVPHGVEALYV